MKRPLGLYLAYLSRFTKEELTRKMVHEELRGE